MAVINLDNNYLEFEMSELVVTRQYKSYIHTFEASSSRVLEEPPKCKGALKASSVAASLEYVIVSKLDNK